MSLNAVIANNTNLHPLWHRFSVIAQYWSNYRIWQGVASRYCTPGKLWEYWQKSYIAETRFFECEQRYYSKI